MSARTSPGKRGLERLKVQADAGLIEPPAGDHLQELTVRVEPDAEPPPGGLFAPREDDRHQHGKEKHDEHRGGDGRDEEVIGMPSG